MPNGLWNKETYLGASEKTKDAMTFDMLHDIHENVSEWHKDQPTKCAELMDKKISINNKLNRRTNLSLGTGGGLGAFGLLEVIRRWFLE